MAILNQILPNSTIHGILMILWVLVYALASVRMREKYHKIDTRKGLMLAIYGEKHEKQKFL